MKARRRTKTTNELLYEKPKGSAADPMNTTVVLDSHRNGLSSFCACSPF